MLFCNVEFTNMNRNIHHAGVVVRIENDIIYVKILQQSACSGCHAKSVCNASESKEKIIEVEDHTGEYHIGEQVSICGETSLGLQAVFLAFVIPLFILLASIAIGTWLGYSETTTGLAGLVMLIPYYFILYKLRDRLKKQFVFKLGKF